MTNLTRIRSAVLCVCGLRLCSVNNGKILFVQPDVEVTVNIHDYCFQMAQKLNIVTI